MSLVRLFASVNATLTLAPDLFIAIGGGGFIPARILRTFCKNIENGNKRNIPIQAVGLYLYESMGGVGLLRLPCADVTG